jgi:hypothetical protein
LSKQLPVNVFKYIFIGLDKSGSNFYGYCGVSISTCHSTCAAKQEGINHSWRRIRNIMSSQTIVTTRMKLENKDSLIVRNMTRPNQEQIKIYHALKFKQTNPKMRKKAVVPHK